MFAAEWFSLSVNFFTAWDGVVMFSQYFKKFCILVLIATKSPDLLQHRSRKSPDSSWKSFSPPITTCFSTKSRRQNFVPQALLYRQINFDVCRTFPSGVVITSGCSVYIQITEQSSCSLSFNHLWCVLKSPALYSWQQGWGLKPCLSTQCMLSWSLQLSLAPRGPAGSNWQNM